MTVNITNDAVFENEEKFLVLVSINLTFDSITNGVNVTILDNDGNFILIVTLRSSYNIWIIGSIYVFFSHVHLKCTTKLFFFIVLLVQMSQTAKIVSESDESVSVCAEVNSASIPFQGNAMVHIMANSSFSAGKHCTTLAN